MASSPPGVAGGPDTTVVDHSTDTPVWAVVEEYAADSCSPLIPTRTAMSMKVRPKITGMHPAPMAWRGDFVPYPMA